MCRQVAMIDAMEPAAPNPESPPPTAPERSLIIVTHAVYALQAVGILLLPAVLITWIVGVVINYLKREEAAGTFVASHFRWQMRTFWFGLLWGFLGAVTFIIVIGWFILIAAGIWIIYRVVKGWLYLVDGKPLYTEPTRG